MITYLRDESGVRPGVDGGPDVAITRIGWAVCGRRTRQLFTTSSSKSVTTAEPKSLKLERTYSSSPGSVYPVILPNVRRSHLLQVTVSRALVLSRCLTGANARDDAPSAEEQHAELRVDGEERAERTEQPGEGREQLEELGEDRLVRTRTARDLCLRAQTYACARGLAWNLENA